jgi:hypothetical protein
MDPQVATRWRFVLGFPTEPGPAPAPHKSIQRKSAVFRWNEIPSKEEQ